VQTAPTIPGVTRRAAATLAALAIGALSPGAQAADAELTVDLGGARLTLRLVPQGSFRQGSPLSEPGREPDETAREVRISRDFYVGQHPVTRGQFARFVSATGYRTEAEKGASGGHGWDGSKLVQRPEFTWKSPGFAQTDDHPVVLVTYGDALAFLDWASQRAGRRLRLPTEAEFEYAARAGTKTPWYSGSTELDAAAIGWFRPGTGGGGTRPVGQLKANAFGLHDMSGNVYQWCSDFYAPYEAGPVTDPARATPPGGGEPERRVLRGGSWLKEPKRGRSAARYRNTPGSRNADNGFRVASDVNAAAVQAAPLSAGGAAPPATGTPSPTSTTTTSGGGMSFIEIVLLLVIGGAVLVPLGAAGVAIFLLVRSSRRAAGAQGVTPRMPARGDLNWEGFAVRPGNDGFWIRAPQMPAGTRVRYTCAVGGSRTQSEVPLSGAMETFVYTGGAPQGIQILGAAAPMATRPAAVAAAHASSWESSSYDAHSASVHRDPEPFVGFPSAY